MKQKRKFDETFIYTIIIAYIINFFATGVISYEFDELFFSKIINKDNNLFMIINNYLIYTIPLIIILLLAILLKKNRYMLKTFSFKNKNNKLLLGFGIGFLLNSICVIVAFLHGDINLTFGSLNIFMLVFALIAVIIQCTAEEMLYRVFIYEKLRKSYKSPWIAIVLNSLFFSLAHIYNDGVTVIALISIFEIGILTSLMVYKYDNIWCAIGIHTAWNFSQNIIYGLPNSGMTASYSLFKLIEAKNSFAYHTIFGVEATIVAVIVLLITSLIIYAYSINKTNNIAFEK